VSISFANKITVPSGVLINEIDGESVLLNLGTESYFGLDESGTRMWSALTTSSSIQGAYETLLSEYEVDSNTLRQDLSSLVEKLVENGLLEVS
jgi:hypothetical protein